MEVLYIAAAAPYDTVEHGGGQTLNYYLKSMAKYDNAKISMMTYIDDSNNDKIDAEKYGIVLYPIIKPEGIKKYFWNCLSLNSKFNPFHKYGNIMTYSAERTLKKKLIHIRDEGYTPDIIVLEWTQIVLLTSVIKEIYPKSKIVASEHDVTFLSKERIAKVEKNPILKKYRLIQAKNMKKRELECLNNCNLIYCHNSKDDMLLEKNGVKKEKRRVLVPYFHKSSINRESINNDILFYGSMSRKENHDAAIWFIEKVLPLLNDIKVRFVVIGGNPKKSLISMANERIVVTGYVPKIDPYFSNALCFVSPLIVGAGIKIKVLEALYTGIPVLTNSIGIEGIPAVNGKDYIMCNTPKDYALAIKKLLCDCDYASSINGKQMIEKKFDYYESQKSYYAELVSLLNKYIWSRR